ncbi:MAG: ArsR/SmtB family transcription factor [Candidatus Asgardarchaeia archaeon]
MIVISKDDPTQARYLIDALSDKTRLEIIKLLITSPTGLTAAQIARFLNKTIPTILSHLELLTQANLLKIGYQTYRGRALKVYSLADKEIRLEIDLERLVWVPLRSHLDLWVSQYIKIKRSTSILPSKISVKDIAKTLNIDERTAKHVKEKIENEQQWLSSLVNEALQLLSKRNSVSIAELSNYLSIARNWAMRLAENLVSQGYAIKRDNMLNKAF